MSESYEEVLLRLPIGPLGWGAMLALAGGMGSAIAAALTLPSGFLVGYCTCGVPWWGSLWMDLTILVFLIAAAALVVELIRLRRLARKIVLRSARPSHENEVWTQPPEP